MNTSNRSLFVLLLVLLAAVPVFSQNTDTVTKKTESKSTQEKSREDGLVG
ncbi:MAG: hypothetical protein IPK96_08610 [Flammeovirgaceae bacterium]|nr:hypothetical protein [Flammeovirgaceae bacterium]